MAESIYLCITLLLAMLSPTLAQNATTALVCPQYEATFCWTCDAADLQTCYATGTLRQCHMNNPRCYVDNGAGGVRMGCMAKEDCTDRSIADYCSEKAACMHFVPCLPGDDIKDACWTCPMSISQEDCYTSGAWTGCTGDNMVCMTKIIKGLQGAGINGAPSTIQMDCINSQTCTNSSSYSSITSCNDRIHCAEKSSNSSVSVTTTEEPIEPCCCSVEDDPRVTTFDGEGMDIDVDNNTLCNMVNTLTEVNDVTICRYKICVSFENKQPKSVTVILRAPGDPGIYLFHVPAQIGDTFPTTPVITVTQTGGLSVAECTVPGCDFKISLDVGVGAKARICIERGDPNLGACHGGLCGNCNNIFDDYVLRNGTDVSHLSNKFAVMKSSFCQ